MQVNTLNFVECVKNCKSPCIYRLIIIFLPMESSNHAVFEFRILEQKILFRGRSHESQKPLNPVDRVVA